MLNTIALRAGFQLLTTKNSLRPPARGESSGFWQEMGKKKKGKKEPRFCPFFPHADLPKPILNLPLGSTGLLLLA
jgi:hypothetical protein